jgi:hypothetical protein
MKAMKTVFRNTLCATLVAGALIPNLAQSLDLTPSSGNTITGAFSSASGVNNAISGASSFGFGFQNSVAGDFNTAFGAFNILAGSSNLASGSNLTVSGNFNSVFGAFNQTETTAIFNLLGGANNALSGDQGFVFGRFLRDGGFNGNVILSDSDPGEVRRASPFTSPEADKFSALFRNGFFFSGQGLGSNSIPENHVMLIEDQQPTNSGVLALKLGDNNPSTADNLITFFRQDGTAIGRIEAVNATTTRYITSGADFAETLPFADDLQSPEIAEIVPVHHGEIGNWDKADHFMVVSGEAGFLGNNASDIAGKDPRNGNIAFIGQLPVVVHGAVEAGDYVLASEANDGTGIAKRADQISVAEMHRVVGRAWESNSEEQLKEVNTAVGLDQTSLVVPALARIEERSERLERENAELKARLARLEGMLEKAVE